MPPGPAAEPPSVPEPLSVVVPMHDEEENVRPLLEEVFAAVGALEGMELVAVDDGSGDGTAARLFELKLEFPRLRLLRHRERCGQSAALRTGVLAARGTVVATLDGDGQNDPADLPALLEAWRGLKAQGGRALVAGHRRDRKDGPWRRLVSRVANGVRDALLHDGTPDSACGIKVFDRDLFLELPFFDHVHRFLPALALRAGARVVSVGVRHRPRTRGRSKVDTWGRAWEGTWDLLGVLWLRRRSRLPVVEEL